MRYVIEVTAEQAHMVEQAARNAEDAQRTLVLMLSVLAAGRAPNGMRFQRVSYTEAPPPEAIHVNGGPPHEGPAPMLHFDLLQQEG